MRCSWIEMHLSATQRPEWRHSEQPSSGFTRCHQHALRVPLPHSPPPAVRSPPEQLAGHARRSVQTSTRPHRRNARNPIRDDACAKHRHVVRQHGALHGDTHAPATAPARTYDGRRTHGPAARYDGRRGAPLRSRARRRMLCRSARRRPWAPPPRPPRPCASNPRPADT